VLLVGIEPMGIERQILKNRNIRRHELRFLMEEVWRFSKIHEDTGVPR
jgi:hypothetical protein